MRYGDFYSLWISEQVKSGETDQCKRNMLDGGFNNPVYRLFPNQPSRSNRVVRTWLLPAFIYLGLGNLGGWYGAGHGTNSHVSTARWRT